MHGWEQYFGHKWWEVPGGALLAAGLTVVLLRSWCRDCPFQAASFAALLTGAIAWVALWLAGMELVPPVVMYLWALSIAAGAVSLVAGGEGRCAALAVGLAVTGLVGLAVFWRLCLRGLM